MKNKKKSNIRENVKFKMCRYNEISKRLFIDIQNLEPIIITFIYFPFSEANNNIEDIPTQICIFKNY